jgi:excisionase family DNA binding protein
MSLEAQIAEAVVALMIERGLVVPQPFSANDELLTPEQAAERLKVAPDYVRRLCSLGKLDHVKLNKRGLRIRPNDLRAFMQQSAP